jgi:hypothetical protein
MMKIEGSGSASESGSESISQRIESALVAFNPCSPPPVLQVPAPGQITLAKVRAVLRIRDILVRIRISRLTDPDPTPFLSDFKEYGKDSKKKKKYFSKFFLITYPQAHCLQS